MTAARLNVSFKGSGYLTVDLKDGETKEEFDALANDEILSRVVSFDDLADCIDQDDVDIDDIEYEE